MIDFETPKPIAQLVDNVLKTVAINMMRPQSRYYDEHEHEVPWHYITFMHSAMSAMGAGSLAPDQKEKTTTDGKPRPRIGYQRLAHMLEMLSWGDTGMYLVTPGGGLGAAAVEAAGTPEQKQKFLARFQTEKPTFGAMAMTESQAGSDTSAIRATAVLDKETNEWVLNGEKIFVTGGKISLELSDGFVVVWATIDPSAGRAGMRSFVVPAGTLGVQVTKLEHKLGIRCSDTASIVMQDARVPFDHILGSAEVVRPEATSKGFKGAMATFDATRPLVAAMAIGVARATVEMVKELLAEQGIQIRYGLPRNKLTSLERDVIEMEVLLRSAWLLVLKAVWMADNRIPNSAEASMCKVRAGDVVTRITQKAVEIMGPLGYTTDTLLEKWFRDAKISDIYEGTGQINRLVVARNILGYSGKELR
jgi:acyl-CoA dehydrogenase